MWSNSSQPASSATAASQPAARHRAVGGLPVPEHRAADHQVGPHAAGGQRRTEHPGLLLADRREPVVVGRAPGGLAVPDQQQHAHAVASSISRLQRCSRYCVIGRNRAYASLVVCPWW